MASQDLIRQCWNNAFESEGDYSVPVDSPTQAIALRAQCHKWRRKQAEAMYPAEPERYFLYEFEIRIVQADEKICVVFSKGSAGLVLPEPVRKESLPTKMFFCTIDKAGETVIEQHGIPAKTPIPGFISAFPTLEEAEQSIKNWQEPVAKKSIFPTE